VATWTAAAGFEIPAGSLDSLASRRRRPRAAPGVRFPAV